MVQNWWKGGLNFAPFLSIDGFLYSYLTNSTGNDPSMSLNSSLASSMDIKVDKWKNLTRRGISVNFPKSLRISGLDFSEDAEISIGVSFFSSQTAVGSTLRKASLIGEYKTFNLTRIPAILEQIPICPFPQHLVELFHIRLEVALWC